MIVKNINDEIIFDYNEYLKQQELLYEELVGSYSNQVLDLNSTLMDREKFKKIYRHIYLILEEGFEIDKIRKYKMNITFNNKDYYEMELRHLLINMIFLRAFVELDVDVELDNSYFFDAYNINNGLIASYINEKIIIPFKDQFTDTEEDLMKFNIVLHDIIYRLNKIPKDFNPIMGMTINLEDSFIKVAKENKRFNEIIRTKLPETMQPKEIENHLNDLMREEIQILSNTPNCLQPILLARTGIKDDSLREFSISGGLKSDLQGNTIPIPINTNYVVGGLNTISNYYLDAQAARKSLIANKEKMGNSGHFALLLKLSCVGMHVDEIEDCYTSHTTELHITNKTFLKMCAGRYYRFKGKREFHILKSTDEHLIGKDLLFRDPSKCACNNGKICKTCYGTLSKVNKGMDVGIFAATIISRPLSQNILSTKHLNTTNSSLIEFNDTFDKFFKLEANQIRLLNDNESDMDMSQYEFYLDNIFQIDELSDDVDFNKFMQFVKIRNIKNHEEYYEVVENDGKELFIHPEFDKIVKNTEIGENNEIIIPFDKLTEETLFTINIVNNELTKPLKEMEKLLSGSVFKGMDVTIDLMEQKFIELLIESNIMVNSVHASILIKSFVREKGNNLKRPDFGKIFVDYSLLGLHNSLADNPSITNSLAYDYLKKQLTTYSTFNKCESSPLDVFFARTLGKYINK